MLSFSKPELYPKLCIRTSAKPASCGSHAWGQKRLGSNDFDHVLREPPPKPCTKIRSATTGSEGSFKVVNPNGPLLSLEDASSALVSRLKIVRVMNDDRLEDGAAVLCRLRFDIGSMFSRVCDSKRK